jgi:hypothetical protein
MDILERWYTDTHLCFRLIASDDRRYVLRYDLDREEWELVMQENAAG